MNIQGQIEKNVLLSLQDCVIIHLVIATQPLREVVWSEGMKT